MALSYFADSVGYETGIPLSVDGFNRSLGDRVAEKAMSCLSGVRRSLFLGLLTSRAHGWLKSHKGCR